MRYYHIYSWTILITTVGEKGHLFWSIICHEISVWTLNPPLNIWNHEDPLVFTTQSNSWTKPENQRRYINAKWKEHFSTVLKKLSYFISSVVKTRSQIHTSAFWVLSKLPSKQIRLIESISQYTIPIRSMYGIFAFGWRLLVIVYR